MLTVNIRNDVPEFLTFGLPGQGFALRILLDQKTGGLAYTLNNNGIFLMGYFVKLIILTYYSSSFDVLLSFFRKT
jgi:hypothetical protein